jgi:hypothetical protein
MRATIVADVNRLAILRLTWGLLALPLALLSLIGLLATWPAVLANKPLNLIVMAYLVLLPLLPASWPGKRPWVVSGLALVTVAVQWALLGFVNRWF